MEPDRIEQKMEPLSQTKTTKTPSGMRRFPVDAVQLIGAMRARPCLWARSHALYRQRAAKQRAWRDVCELVHPRYPLLSSAEKHQLEVIIMRKWYNIRDAYKKAQSTEHRQYVYSDLLTFLEPCLERARRGPASPAPASPAPASPQGEASDDEPADGEEWLNVFQLEEESSPTPPPAKRSKPRGEYDVGDADDSLVSMLVNLLEKEEDEDRAFFKSITPAVKALSDEAKFVFRIQVMKLLNSMRKTGAVKIEAGSERSDDSD